MPTLLYYCFWHTSVILQSFQLYSFLLQSPFFVTKSVNLLLHNLKSLSLSEVELGTFFRDVSQKETQKDFFRSSATASLLMFQSSYILDISPSRCDSEIKAWNDGVVLLMMVILSYKIFLTTKKNRKSNFNWLSPSPFKKLLRTGIRNTTPSQNVHSLSEICVTAGPAFGRNKTLNSTSLPTLLKTIPGTKK